MDNIAWSYDSIDNWYHVVEGKVVCDFCGKETSGVFFISEEESACLSCILNSFSEAASVKIYNTKDGYEILNAFEPESTPTIKIGMLLNMDRLLESLTKIPETKKLRILYYITLSLGYNSSHPLGPLLRSIAVNKIILGADTFLRVLLDDIEVDLTLVQPIDPQIFRYNLALTLSFLAPYNRLTKTLIEKVLVTAKERKDTFILNWFVLKKGYYFPSGDFFSREYAAVNLIKAYRIANEVSVSKSCSNKYWIKQTLDEIYTLKYLKNIYNLYLHNVHRKAELSPQFVWPGNKAKKKDYVRIFSEILLNKKLANVFLEELPDWVKTSLEEMLWEDNCLPLNEFEVRGNLKVPKADRLDYYFEAKLPPESQLFQVWVNRRYYGSRGEVFLFLDELQTDLFRSCLPISENCKLHLKDSYNSDLFVSSNTEILTQLRVIVIYLHQFGIKRAKNGVKILKSSIKDVRSVCSIEELYPEVKDLENLRLIVLLELVEKLLKNKKNIVGSSSDKLLKTLFSFCFSPKESVLFNYCQFLDYLKSIYFGTNKAAQNRFYQERLAVKKLLEQMEVGKWVEINNIHRYFNGQASMPEPFNLSENDGEIYFSTKDADSYRSMDRTYVSYANRGETIYKPYLKVLMFVLNTLGVLEIAYTMPVNSKFQDKSNQWLSVYDGIREVSLTPMGAWLIGRTKTFEGIKKESSAKVDLDDKRLIVTVEGKDPIIELTLKRMSRPLGPGSFIVSSDVFLQDCESVRDIKEKINKFKLNIDKNPPLVWETFFNSLLQKVDPFEFETDEMLLFRLNPSDKDLISLLFSDPHLKLNVMKVEDYHVLIKKGSYKMVKNRLAEYGYFLPHRFTLSSSLF